MKTVDILKKQIIIIFLLSLVVRTAYTQGIKVYSYTESNKFSTRLGIAVGFETSGLFEFGAFYQVSPGRAKESGLEYETKFAGGYVAMPIVAKANFNIKFKTRVGMVNNENFVITPSLDTQFFLKKFIGFGFGVGSRNLRPTAMTTIILKVNNGSNRRSGYSKRSYRR